MSIQTENLEKFINTKSPSAVFIRDLPESSLKELQQLLIANGQLANGEDDGVFGPKTNQAFRQFKEVNRLTHHPEMLGLFTLEALLEGAERLSGATKTTTVTESVSTLRLPTNEVVPLHSLIWQGTPITWSEMTKGGSRVPESPYVVTRIRDLCKALEPIRKALGPMHITSGYRDLISNHKVGGARNSRHLHGDAIDFVSEDWSPEQVYAQLNPIWHGGLASSTNMGFTHIDLGPKRRWVYG